MQDLIVGQGRSGDVLRNLLWEVAERDEDGWASIVGHARDLFGLRLLRPSYAPHLPYIRSEYLDRGADKPLDLSSAGSGTLQVLLLLAFLHARPGSVLLLDEPDAHQHVVLQRDVHARLRRVARERDGQLIVATHAETLINATAPERILAFVGDSPRRLANRSERDQIREALKTVTTLDLLRAAEAGSALYLEGSTDESILREWARVLDHPVRRLLDRGCARLLRGRSLSAAEHHFFGLRAHFPNIGAVCLLDGDRREEAPQETTRSGLHVLRWKRYEIENYLLQPAAVARFLEDDEALERFEQSFWALVPPGTDLLGDHFALVNVKASEVLVDWLADTGRPTPKIDLHLIAAAMRPEEIHGEVVSKLDLIAEHLGGASSLDSG